MHSPTPGQVGQQIRVILMLKRVLVQVPDHLATCRRIEWKLVLPLEWRVAMDVVNRRYDLFGLVQTIL